MVNLILLYFILITVILNKFHNQTYSSLVFCVLSLFSSICLVLQAQGSSFLSEFTNAVYKFEINQTGIYKIDIAFLRKLGIDTNNIDPSTLQVFGREGGSSLSLQNATSLDFGLKQYALKFIGNQDTKFDNGEYFLFYAQSTKAYHIDNDSFLNPYSDKAFYYLTFSSQNSNRVEDYISGQITQTNDTITSFVRTVFHENDELSIANVGRKRHELILDDRQTTYTLSIDTPNALDNSMATLTTVMASTTKSLMGVNIFNLQQSLASDFLVSHSWQPNPANTYAVESRKQIDFTISTNDKQNQNFAYQFNSSGSNGSKVYLDYMSLKYYCRNDAFLKQQDFGIPSDYANGIYPVVLENLPSTAVLWEVTDPYNPRQFLLEEQQSLIYKKLHFTATANQHFFIASEFLQPTVSEDQVSIDQLSFVYELLESVKSQGLTYLLITSEVYLDQAQQLADYHASYRNIRTTVLTLEQIYAVATATRMDIAAIRDVVRLLYEASLSTSEPLKYLCLFGDTSVDYKNSDALSNINPAHFVPSYQSINSYTSLSNSMVSDDFFGVLQSGQGNMRSQDNMDIAVGRILCNTSQQAKHQVEKIINYDKQSLKDWHNNILLISDDVDTQSDFSLQENLDLVAYQVQQQLPQAQIQKVYTDAYIQQQSASQETYPEAQKDIIDYINKGSNLVTYFGHGSVDRLASENLITIQTLLELSNKDRYPWLVTLTCDATRYDNPSKLSIGEQCLQLSDAGFMGLISTTRSVFLSTATTMNAVLMEKLLHRSTNNQKLENTIGEALRLTKNELFFKDKYVVSLFGDPILSLQFPTPRLRVTKVNDTTITDSLTTLSALEPFVMKGVVLDSLGIVDSSYTGTVDITIRDKPTIEQTKANDYQAYFEFEGQSAILYKGKASINQGIFSFQGILPKSMNLSSGEGKLSLFAAPDNYLDSNKIIVEQYQPLELSGISDAVLLSDQQPPQIQVYLPNGNPIDGQVIANQTQITLEFIDSSGINMMSGIGHSPRIIIDDNTDLSTFLSDEYTTTLDDQTKVVTEYRLPDLSLGDHQLKLEVRDVYGNLAIHRTIFTVSASQGIELHNIALFSNVIDRKLYFNYDFSVDYHDIISIDVNFYDIKGSHILQSQVVDNLKYKHRHNAEVLLDDSVLIFLETGVYVVKVSFNSLVTNTVKEAFIKLVVL